MITINVVIFMYYTQLCKLQLILIHKPVYYELYNTLVNDVVHQLIVYICMSFPTANIFVHTSFYDLKLLIVEFINY